MSKLNKIEDRRNTTSLKWSRVLEEYPNLKEDVIPMSLADLDFPYPKELIEELKNSIDETVFGYNAPTDEYFDAVTTWFKEKHDWSVKNEEIILSPGVVPAIYNAIKAFTNKDEGVIIMDPVYHPFSMAIENLERKLVTTDLINNDGLYTINFEDLEEKAQDDNNKILILCSPHNPVGRVWTQEELKKIDEITHKHNVLVVSDEIHFDLVRPGYEHTVYATISDNAKNNSIVCTAPSKSFNIAGLKNSNLVIHNEDIRDKFEGFLTKDGSTGSTNILGQKATEIVYRECTYWVDDFNELIDTNYEIAKEFVEKELPELAVAQMQGTYLLWMDFTKLNMDQDELDKLLKDKAQLFLDNGEKFGENGHGFMRMNLGYPSDVVKDAFKRLKDAQIANA